jgi:hypothetical protein
MIYCEKTKKLPLQAPFFNLIKKTNLLGYGSYFKKMPLLNMVSDIIITSKNAYIKPSIVLIGFCV